MRYPHQVFDNFVVVVLSVNRLVSHPAACIDGEFHAVQSRIDDRLGCSRRSQCAVSRNIRVANAQGLRQRDKLSEIFVYERIAGRVEPDFVYSKRLRFPEQSFKKVRTNPADTACHFRVRTENTGMVTRIRKLDHHVFRERRQFRQRWRSMGFIGKALKNRKLGGRRH